MSTSTTLDGLSSIAIIGMRGRFPGAGNTAEFWRNLCDGVESIQVFSDKELATAGVKPSLLNDPYYVKAGGVLDGIEMFDAAFFGFNPREAESMDPQQRLFLECAREALEEAGYDTERYDGLIGLFAGSSISTYLLNNLQSNRQIIESVGHYQILLGNDKDHLTTRVSYKLNLKGPSICVQTACSTSLVAVVLACQSLLDHHCDMALAGGVSIKVPQKIGYLYQEGGIGSPDGHCRVFDKSAKGTVGGNGLGIVVLKRLSDALASGDSILAIIRGAAINNDGSSKIGYTAPGLDGQAEVITLAQALSGIEPETLTYVEAHGTGTPLGDPIEIAALTQAFRARTDKRNFCAIGSVKSNIGHLDPAAGVAGLIKTVLALKNKMLPPSLHFKEANPEINFADSPFYVNDKLSSWERGGTPRRAAVSSFGIGGTNAHVVLEEAPEPEDSPSLRPSHLLLLSARTDTALDAVSSNLVEHLKQHPGLNPADLAYTYQVGRKAFSCRRMFVYQDQDDALKALEAFDTKRVLTARAADERPVIFMFPGQGAQYVGMASGLYESEPAFRAEVDRCSELLKPHLALDLRDALYRQPPDTEEAAQRLQQTAVTQPALFVIEYALARLWMTWGVRPHAMIGHSIGEYVAACLSGVLSLEDALLLVAARGRLMQRAPEGAMLIVPLPEEDARLFLNGRLNLAAINAPSLCVVSGPSDVVAQLEAQLADAGVAGRRLQTSHAFHSDMMEPILGPFADELRRVKLNPPEIPYISNVTGTWTSAEKITDPSYWTDHLRQTVLFAKGLSLLLAEVPRCVLLEVGPGQTLSALARQQPNKTAEQSVHASLRQPHEHVSDFSFLLNTLGRLWLSGQQIDWRGFYADERRQRIHLPTYPFERRRCWVESPAAGNGARQMTADLASQSSLAAGRDVSEWFYAPSWKGTGPVLYLPQAAWLLPKTNWLIFSDDCGVGAGIASRLEAAGHAVITVMVGERFERLGERVFRINPQERAHYQSLLSEVRQAGLLPEKIIHLWSVTSDEHDRSSLEFYQRAQHRGFFSLLFLAQTLGEQSNLMGRLPVLIISNGIQAVTGAETLRPEKATVLGPCKVISQEYPNIVCRSLDLALSSLRTGWSEEIPFDSLLSEFAMESLDPVVAYRNGQRWIQIYEPVRHETSAPALSRLKEGGVYLITGGLGGIGLTLAKHLAERFRARLVLVGRSTFPHRDEWEQWLATHQEDDLTSRKIRHVEALKAAADRVMILSADVSDRQQMRDVISRAHEQFGALHGVIHAAGIAGAGMIQLKTPEAAAAVLAPKVEGALVIDELLKNENLDYIALCSSLSSILGGYGQVDYSAANAFLDAFAHTARAAARAPFTVSINWPTWQEVGMAVNAPLPPDMQEWRNEALAKGIHQNEGVAAFSRILSGRLSQVAIVPPALRAPSESRPRPAASAPPELEPVALPHSAHPRHRPDSAYVAPADEIEKGVADIWQKLLGIDPIGAHDNFFELGGHSLLGVQMVSRLREAYGVELPIQRLFEAPTVAELASAIEELLVAEIEDLPDAEVQHLLREET